MLNINYYNRQLLFVVIYHGLRNNIPSNSIS